MQILIARLQLLLAILVQRNLQGTLNAVSGNDAWQAHGYTAQPVFSVQHDRCRDDRMLITHDRADQAADTQGDTGARIALQLHDVQSADLHLREKLFLVNRL